MPEKILERLRGDLIAEIDLLETGVRHVTQVTPYGRTDVTRDVLAAVRDRLAQVEKLIATFERTS